MAVYLSPVFNAWQGFTVGGLPLNAGQLNTYAAGTSTPVATFTTSAGNVQNANPIILGVDGRPPQEIWLTGGQAYKFVLTDSLLNPIAPYDNIIGIGDPAAATSPFIALTAVAGTNTITANGGIAGYVTGATYTGVVAVTNTGPVLLNIDGKGNKSVTKYGTVALVAGDMVAGAIFIVQDDGTRFQLLSIPSTNQIANWIKGAAIASAATLTPGTDGNYFHVTGNTGPITAIADSAPSPLMLVLDGSPTITNSAGLILPSGLTLTGAIPEYGAGTRLIFFKESPGVWRCVFCSILSITALSAALPNSGYQQSGTGGETLRTIRGNVAGNGTITNGTGFSVVRNSAGVYTITFTTAFSAVPAAVGCTTSLTGNVTVVPTTLAVGSVVINMLVVATPTDLPFSFIATGPA
jgi:hypothetical protein